MNKLVDSHSRRSIDARINEIQTQIEDGVLWVRLMRPEKTNALSFAMLAELIRLGEVAKQSRSIQAVVLTGCDGVFSAGIDTKDLSNPKKAPWAFYQLLKPNQSMFQKACLIWKQVPVPVVAVIEGYCWGAGLQLALGADFRIASATADLSIKEASLGLIADMGISRSVQGLLRRDQLLKLLMSAERLSSAQALQLGLLTQVDDDPHQAATALIKELTQNPRAATQAAKALDAKLYRSGALWFEKWTQVKLLINKQRSKSD